MKRLIHRRQSAYCVQVNSVLQLGMSSNLSQTATTSEPPVTVTMDFTTQLLLTEKSWTTTPDAGTPEQELQLLEERATRMTRLLTHIHGYSHGGLNE